MWQLVLVANTTCTARVQRKQQHQIPQDIDWLSCFSPYVPCWTTYIHCYTMVLFESRGFLSDLQFLFTGVPKVDLLAKENWWSHVIDTREELWTHNSCASGQFCWFSVLFCSLYTVMLMEQLKCHFSERNNEMMALSDLLNMHAHLINSHAQYIQ